MGIPDHHKAIIGKPRHAFFVRKTLVVTGEESWTSEETLSPEADKNRAIWEQIT
jgi:hypothetical protein